MSRGWRVHGWDPYRPRADVWVARGGGTTRRPDGAMHTSHENASEMASDLNRTRQLGLRWTIEVDNERNQP